MTANPPLSPRGLCCPRGRVTVRGPPRSMERSRPCSRARVWMTCWNSTACRVSARPVASGSQSMPSWRASRAFSRAWGLRTPGRYRGASGHNHPAFLLLEVGASGPVGLGDLCGGEHLGPFGRAERCWSMSARYWSTLSRRVGVEHGLCGFGRSDQCAALPARAAAASYDGNLATIVINRVINDPRAGRVQDCQRGAAGRRGGRAGRALTATGGAWRQGSRHAGAVAVSDGRAPCSRERRTFGRAAPVR